MQWVEKEITSSIYLNPTIYRLSDEQKEPLYPVLIQQTAAARVAPYNDVVLRLTRLKSVKATRNMGEEETALLLSEIANMLIHEKYCYTAIDEGIKKIMKLHKSDFFPSPETFIQYIYPINYKIQQRTNKLHEMLSREKHLQLEKK